MTRTCIVRDLGRMGYAEALSIQQSIADERKRGEGFDHLLFVEHPHVVTVGRNGHEENILASEEMLRRGGIELHYTDRGGDVTYHGPGQVVGYPIVDLREWKRDVGAYVRAVEQTIIEALGDFGIEAERIPKLTGVWTRDGALHAGAEGDRAGAEGDRAGAEGDRAGAEGDRAGAEGDRAKIAAIGVHLSRWVSTHGWALNVTTDLRYFQYIIPCGLAKPVTSMAALGVRTAVEDVKEALARRFGENFDFEMQAEAPAIPGRA
jgi:lipoyl(octanoyl) transferase